MGMKPTDEERKLLAQWTEVDGDLDQIDPDLADKILTMRTAFGRGNIACSPYWENPEGVDAVTDLDYAGDGLRAHKLDVYYPHDAVVRGGKTTPVYIDIHGGGFVHEYKELNRNFCTHLADRGFVVFSLNYRLAPSADYLGQMQDVMTGMAWVKEHLADYPCDPEKIFITGDSVGGVMALYAVAIEHSKAMADSLGLKQAGLNVLGGTLVSGMHNLRPLVEQTEDYINGSMMDVITMMATRTFATLKATNSPFIDLDYMAANVDLPPLFLNTSNDDFLQGESLLLGAALAAHGRDFEVHDRHARKGETLGHIYPVCMTWLPESQDILHKIRDFSYNLF
ncbi:alpha/beta hydrolase [Bifidobacterium sp. ESL0798]|uniref:alpha/beta hydrolase n=1 Tax=Bifidobacterium sp. ESL0798 TaxID=2983235 RepID=UPI0023F74824|nr:alpha/beta hydrolase [Bifidobacterium sp. ESL0798]WEV73683.1 alpha/beta hydrolase [Bifidobacterium sp. ESL0798]